MDTQRPTAIVIIGGAGDLAQRKLFPALFTLFQTKKLPQNVHIIGIARTLRTDNEYRALISEALSDYTKKTDKGDIEAFVSHAHYIAGSFDDSGSYQKVSEALAAFEAHQKPSVHSNRLFYLAVPPMHYDVIFKKLHESGIATKHDNSSWSRILVEKPFGRDLETALALEEVLRTRFSEDQIFRIDHYLAKEAVLNILAFRFANPLIQTVWNRKHIQEIRIRMHEKANVDKRGAFYDTVGAVRDVGQNHILQILALIAMDKPKTFSSTDIRSAREQILSTLLPIQAGETALLQRAQYDTYRQTPGVPPNSETETFFQCSAFLDHPNWQQVPFYLSAGKGLNRDEVSIEIIFHDVHDGPFGSKAMATQSNKIFLTISPVQSTNLTLNMKVPGHGFAVETNTLSFAWDEETEKGYSAYEKILLDCLFGDQTLFTKTEEVLASWKFIDSLLSALCTTQLYSYAEGSSKPADLL